ARHPQIEDIVRQAVKDSRLALAPIGADDAASSQDAGLRHRRIGLSARLDRALRQGRWVPPKRVAPARLTRRQRLVYILREIMAERSHAAFQEALEAGSFAIFAARMTPYMALHDWLNRNQSLRSSLARLAANAWRSWLHRPDAK
ncbi:MAG TPA: hypothetical protein VFS85_04405, partial [Dongiaceae bacterium]|nr:hypothetical protein [Dongiaceae bacterium]